MLAGNVANHQLRPTPQATTTVYTRPLQVLLPPAARTAASSRVAVVAKHSGPSSDAPIATVSATGATALLDEDILQDELAASGACGTAGWSYAATLQTCTLQQGVQQVHLRRCINHIIMRLRLPGHILMRPAPEGVTPNGKRYHIHTFGCQVRVAPASCARVCCDRLLSCTCMSVLVNWHTCIFVCLCECALALTF